MCECLDYEEGDRYQCEVCAEMDRGLRSELETYRADHEIKAANLATCKERLQVAEARAEMLGAALREIAKQPCDCGCPLDGGQHMHDCVTRSDAVEIARAALSRLGEAKP